MRTFRFGPQSVSLVVGLYLTAFTLYADHGEPHTFKVKDPAGRDTVRFVLDAPFEVIHGTTNAIEGEVKIHEGMLSGTFQVPVSSIKTGIEDRDEHLQNEKWLNAKKYPLIEVKFQKIKVPPSLFQGKAQKIQAPATISLHGQKKNQTVALTLQYFKQNPMTEKRLPGNLLRIRGKFKVQLASYGIAQSDSKVKALLGLKVGETAEVEVEAMATDKAR